MVVLSDVSSQNVWWFLFSTTESGVFQGAVSAHVGIPWCLNNSAFDGGSRVEKRRWKKSEPCTLYLRISTLFFPYGKLFNPRNPKHKAHKS